nr:MAG TPA: hypothetical protein [Caudoviricetes sp.]
MSRLRYLHLNRKPHCIRSHLLRREPDCYK